MKVLFVVRGKPGGMISIIVENQATSLRKKGIEIDFFIIKGKGLTSYLLNIPKLWKFGRVKSYDLVHSHYFYSALVSSFAMLKTQVVSLMGSDIYSDSFQRVIIKIFSRLFWSKTIVKSSEMKIVSGLKKAEIIPNGVNMELFSPMPQEYAINELGWHANRKHVLFIGSPERYEKNYPLAKSAVGKINSFDVELHVIERFSLNKMPLIYSAADVLLLTSLYEGSPNVIKEAMACNCPIVSTDVGDVKNIIGSTEGCYLSAFDKEDVALKIEQALIRNHRTEGRDKISHLESGIIADRIIYLYKSFCKS